MDKLRSFRKFLIAARFRTLQSLLLAHLCLAALAAGAEEGARTLLGEPWRWEHPPGLRYGAPIDTGTYQYGNPTAAEQAHLERINRARLNRRGRGDLRHAEGGGSQMKKSEYCS